MTIHHAKKFIDRGMNEQPLRDELNGVASIDGLYAALEHAGLSFTPGEFEDAYSNRLTQCQFEEQADQLNEFKMWWDLLHQFLGGISGGSSGGCAPGASCSSDGGCRSCHG